MKKNKLAMHLSRTDSPKVIILKRRLPRPTTQPPHPLHAHFPLTPPVVTNPAAWEVAEHIQRLCSISRLDPYVVLTDFFTMCMYHLQLYGINMKSLVIEGKAAEDPPDAKSFFRRARERFDRATLQYPGTFRVMMETYSVLYTKLREARPLAEAVLHPEINPDLIAQVFVACLRPGPEWWPYFPDWQVALEMAKRLIPDPPGTVQEILAEASLAYEEASGESYQEIMTSEAWELWAPKIYPFVKIKLFPPPFINCSTLLLALAAQFPEWVLTSHLVHFHMDESAPLIHTMGNVAGMLYGLNGASLAMLQDILDIQDYLQQHQHELLSTPLSQQQPVEEEPDEQPLPELAPPLSGSTFEELFRMG
ncbi:MAG: hypothetical protein BroJett011_42360 [Chloroflexota bacterium]|nr:MAG: hypothetical protein BroJett011_42360 [Chloroflexota bacterium]